jgi:hypothetical protein
MFAKTQAPLAFVSMAVLAVALIVAGCGGDSQPSSTSLSKQALYVDDCGESYTECVETCVGGGGGSGGEGEGSGGGSGGEGEGSGGGSGGEGEGSGGGSGGEGEGEGEGGSGQNPQQDDGRQALPPFPRDLGLNSDGTELCIEACQTTLVECTDEAKGVDDSQNDCVGLFDTCVGSCQADFEVCLAEDATIKCRDDLDACVNECVIIVDDCVKSDPGTGGDDGSGDGGVPVV